MQESIDNDYPDDYDEIMDNEKRAIETANYYYWLRETIKAAGPGYNHIPKKIADDQLIDW